MSFFSDCLTSAFEQISVIKNLEERLQRLPHGARDITLLSNVHTLFHLHQDAISSQSLIQRACQRTLEYFNLDDTTPRIHSLFFRTLRHHELELNGNILCARDFFSLVERNQIDTLRFLLDSGGALSEGARGWAVIYAAENHLLNMIEVLLENRAIISEEDRSRAVIRTALNGHQNIIEALLANGPISEEARRQALNCAAENGHLNIIKALVANSTTISESDRSVAVMRAGRHGHQNIIEALLSNGPISEEARRWVLDYAVENGYPNIIIALLKNGARISQEERSGAVLDAAENGHLNIIQALLENEATISEPVRGMAVIYAAKSGHRNIVQALLENGATISAEHRIQAIRKTSPNRPDILQLLATTDALRRLVLTPPRPQASRLEVNLEQLHHKPIHYLDLIVDQGFPRNISILGSIGIDEGGLRKEFVSRLVQSLQPCLALTEDQLPLIDFDDSNADAKKETLRKFGVFLSDLFEANTQRSGDPFLIGQLFHSRFFDIVKLILEKQPADQTLKSLARILQEVNPSLSSLTQVILTPYNAKAKEAFANYFGFCMDTDNIAKEAEKMLLSYLEGPKALLNGLTPQLEYFIHTHSCQEICPVLQGKEATVESLLRALNLQRIDINHETADVFEKQKCWIKEKIIGSDLAWRRAFIQWATGRTTLAPATSIILQSTNSNELVARTCYNTIDFPLEARSKEAFLAALDDLPSDLQYNMA